MNVLMFMIPLALLLGLFFVVAFFWATSSGQFDDLDTPPVRMLIDSKNIKPNTTMQEDSLEPDRNE